jgi:hypothetical protein
MPTQEQKLVDATDTRMLSTGLLPCSTSVESVDCAADVTGVDSTSGRLRLQTHGVSISFGSTKRR